MIIGEYPCCNGLLSLAMPDQSGTFGPEDCPHCGARVWHHFSRLHPESWTESDFLERYEVIEETREIRERNPPDPPDARMQKMIDIWVSIGVHALEDAIINGTTQAIFTGILGRSVIQGAVELTPASVEVIRPGDLTLGYFGRDIEMIIPDDLDVKMNVIKLIPEATCQSVVVLREPKPVPPWREKRRRLNPKKNKRKRR